MADAQGQAGTIASPLFLGIDLSGNEANPSAWALLEAEPSAELGPKPRLLGWGFDHDYELVALAREHRPAVIAIDAPLSLPRGLHCLEESCPCQPDSPLPGREVERDLSRRGIASYYVTKRTFIKEMVYRGIALRRTLEGRGHRVLEIYPYASKVALWGKPLPKKKTVAGRRWLAGRLAERLAGLDALSPLPQDHVLDAVVAAYTSYLGWWGLAEAVGDAGEGMVYLPSGRAPELMPAEGVEPTTKGL